MITDLRTYILDDAPISAVIGTRLFPMIADNVNGTDPYAVYSIIGSTTVDTHNDVGVLRRDMDSISIHCPTYTETYTTAELFRARLSNVRTALGSYDAHIVVESYADGYSGEDEIHNSTLTLSVTWS